MSPKFLNQESWQQAELLMQPVFIRVIDNIRKQLDQSSWKSSYRDVSIWPDGVSPGIQAQVTQLQKELSAASPEQAAQIQQALDDLPQPFPGYELFLEKGDRHVSVNLWDLCYQICFRDYQPDNTVSASAPVTVDSSLIDEQGEVDWHRLDAKTKELVSHIFAKLPTVTEPVE